MTLSFSTQINGKPNYFIEKIWEGISGNGIIPVNLHNTVKEDYEREYEDRFEANWGYYRGIPKGKLHTIRRDEKNRWRAGLAIHPVIKPKGRFSAGFQFAPVMKCVSVQDIIISRHLDTVYVDSTRLMGKQVKQLAINDGFDGVDEFFDYFSKTFHGKIIHWTDLKY